MKKPRLTVCGVMSGSSLDGLDMAICTFDKTPDGSISWDITKCDTIPFTPQLADDLLASYHASSSFIYEVEQQFSKFCGDALSRFIELEYVDYIGFHGHTLFHEPDKGFTTQIGNAHHITQKLEVPVIAQFRNKDVALGGQGAPLAPIVEKYLFPDYKAFLNLGGIVNISIHKDQEIIAYDVTACNQALNHLASELGLKYDDKGNIAASGAVDIDLLNKFERLDFLDIHPPKSLSNTWVQEEFIAILDQHDTSVRDKMATVVEHIAKEISKCCEDLKKGMHIYCTGGGVYNEFMMKRINDHLKPLGLLAIKPTDEISEFKEALLMALMAYLRINEIPNCLSSVTGASRDSCGGIIYNHAL